MSRSARSQCPTSRVAGTVFRAFVATAFIALILAAWLLLRDPDGLAAWLDREAILARLQALGWAGPVGVIALMTAAILVSPLPSAPIALAAGAAYGHGWGTLYVALGSEFGALAAFALARYLGQEFVHRHLGSRVTKGLAGSQNALMATVFASRLLPFVSFDLVSYAAGLTVLSFPRFALATLAGILPASFLLAHFGAELSRGAVSGAAAVVVLLGVLGVAPVLARFVSRPKGGAPGATGRNPAARSEDS